jgi:glycolate oxidase subunit GlcD
MVSPPVGLERAMALQHRLVAGQLDAVRCLAAGCLLLATEAHRFLMGLDAGLIEALKRELGPEGVLDRQAQRVPYECDGLAFVRQLPELVLLPRDTDQTARAMRLLHEAHVPVVPRGAGTGLSGGATPIPQGVTIGTARMRAVLEINRVDRYARVQAGVVNADLGHACERHGLFYAPDPSSQKACTIGGNVGENSGGPHCFRYGNTSQHVLGLVIVTPQGEVLDLSEPQVDPESLDLIGLFTGSEGLLGIATEVTVRLLPLPALVETWVVMFRSLDDACDATSDLIAAHAEPSAIEILDKLTIEAVESSVLRAGYPQEAEAVMLLELEGTEAFVEAHGALIEPILKARAGFGLRRAREAADRARLWAGRKGAYGAMGRIAPDLYVCDAVVPRRHLRQLVRKTTEICAAKGLRIANVFHAGDGNLHPNISYDRRNADELRRVLEAGEEMMRVCLEAGGSLSGEHGIGLEKLSAMPWLFSPEDLAVMCRVREAWDPEQRMNPGKLLPLRACMETRMRAAEKP